jgi:hypothetical protein
MYKKQASSAKKAGMWSALGGLALNLTMMKAGGLFGKASKGVSKGAGVGMMGTNGEMIRLPY